MKMTEYVVDLPDFDHVAKKLKFKLFSGLIVKDERKLLIYEAVDKSKPFRCKLTKEEADKMVELGCSLEELPEFICECGYCQGCMSQRTEEATKKVSIKEQNLIKDIGDRMDKLERELEELSPDGRELWDLLRPYPVARG